MTVPKVVSSQLLPAFDPAAWLAKAEAAGYQIFATSTPRGLWFGEPMSPRITSDKDLALWRELRPDQDASEANEDALEAYLREIGRVAEAIAHSS